MWNFYGFLVYLYLCKTLCSLNLSLAMATNEGALMCRIIIDNISRCQSNLSVVTWHLDMLLSFCKGSLNVSNGYVVTQKL